MPIRVTCACGKKYTFKDEFAGRRAKCPACGQIVQISDRRVFDAVPPKPATSTTPGGAGDTRAVATATGIQELHPPADVPAIGGKATSRVLYNVEGEFRSLAVSLLILAFLFFFAWGFTAVLTWGIVIVWPAYVIAMASVGIAILYIKAGMSQLLGNALLVTPQSFPRLWEIVQRTCANLKIGTDAVRVYVKQDPSLNAGATGVNQPYAVVINSGCVENLTDEELTAVIGHELGHVQNQHTVVMPFFAPSENVSVPLLSSILSPLFNSYSCKCELTADRASLIACRNPAAAIAALAKLHFGPKICEMAGAAILSQEKMADKELLARYAPLFTDHPLLVNRARALMEFERSDLYSRACNSDSTLGIRKIPGLAAYLSFFLSGLGQLYNGQIGKAIVFFIPALMPCCGFVVALCSIPEAYFAAKKMNQA